jgi:two-component SAPR family response regulator
VLLARGNTTVSIDVLVDALWDDDPPRTAIATLRTYVSRLRRSVDDALVSERGGYRLAVAPGHVDADRFDELRRVAERVGTPAPGSPRSTRRSGSGAASPSRGTRTSRPCSPRRGD